MKKVINFLGIGFEVGQSKKGLELSTKIARKYLSALKKDGLYFVDYGDIASQDFQDTPVKFFLDTDLKNIEWNNYEQAYNKTSDLLKEEAPLLNWGGDHSVAISTVGAFVNHYHDGYVVWIDAHADLNLPSKSLTGNFHGMPLAVLLDLEGVATDHFKWLGKKLDPKKLIYVGLRDVDPFELSIIKSHNIKSFFYGDVLSLGIKNIANKISEITKGSPLHISFDIDSIDPILAPATGVPVKNGLTRNDLTILGEQLFKKSKIRSIDIVEINPMLATEDQVEQTYIVAMSFLKSIFCNIYQGGIYDDMGKRNKRKYSSQMERSL